MLNQQSNLRDRQLSIAVVLPAYNEAMTIRQTIQSFASAIPHARIFVVDNRSSDDTAILARQALDDLGNGGCVISELRPGKGCAVRRAFLDIDADIFVMADADLTYPAECAVDLIKPIANGTADMVVGDRHALGSYSAENKRPLHGFGNILVCRLVNLLFNAKLNDIMSGYRVLSRRFVKSYPILVDGFELETDITLHALDKRLRILEIPVAYKDRPQGSHSKLNTLSDGARVLWTIASVLRFYRPLLFFGTAAALTLALGLVAGTPVILEYVQSAYIRRVPLALLATGLVLISVLFASIGLILDSIRHMDLQTFERNFLALKPIGYARDLWATGMSPVEATGMQMSESLDRAA